jgi:hypothetical protein
MRYGLIVTLVAALSAGPASSQEHVALAVEGWATNTKAEGITAYRCASSVCAAGSEVSYKRQPHRPALTLAEFEAHHRRLAEQNRGTGRIRDLRISAPQERVIDGVRVLQVRRDFEWVDGGSHVLIESRLIGPSSSYSVVSVSSKSEWTINNFEGFLPRLIDIAALTGVD